MLLSRTGVPEKFCNMVWEKFENHPEVGIYLKVLDGIPEEFDKELYLLELIHNACDAMDKVYAQRDKTKPLPKLGMIIVTDKANKRILIMDSGIGMTKEDLVNKLIPLRRPRIDIFGAAGQAGKNERIVWQSGLGFLSTYLVAEQVIVSTKHADDEQYIWFSKDADYFSVTKDSIGGRLHRGTQITLYLKEDLLGYLEEKRIKDLVEKYSEFIWYPVFIRAEKQICDDKDGEAKKDAEGDVVEVDEEKKVTNEWLQTNKQKPIWFRHPAEVAKEDFASLYKCLTNDSEDYLAVKYFNVDGQQCAKAVLFVPKRAVSDHFDTQKKMPGIQLYVERKFFSFDELPEFLGFVKGVVVTDVAPDGKTLDVIRLELVKKCFEMFSQIAESKDDYDCFYEAFSKNLKLGFKESHNIPKLADLLRYYSTKTGDYLTSLKDYVTRMKEGQKDIYCIAGESKKAVTNLPLLQSLREKGYEALFMVDAIDEFVMGQLKEYDGKKLVLATREGLKCADTHSTNYSWIFSHDSNKRDWIQKPEERSMPHYGKSGYKWTRSGKPRFFHSCSILEAEAKARAHELVPCSSSGFLPQTRVVAKQMVKVMGEVARPGVLWTVSPNKSWMLFAYARKCIRK